MTTPMTPGQEEALRRLQQAFEVANNVIDSEGRSALDHVRGQELGAPAVCVVLDILDDMFPPEPTYEVVRFYRDDRPAMVLGSGLTLAEAKAECSGPESSGDGWFDGFRKEG